MKLLGVRVYNLHVFTRYSPNPQERETLASVHVRLYMEGSVEIASLIEGGDLEGAGAAIIAAIDNGQVGPGAGKAEIAKLREIGKALKRWGKATKNTRHNHWILEAGYDYRVDPQTGVREGEVVDLWINAPLTAAKIGKVKPTKAGEVPAAIRKVLEDLAAIKA